MSYDYGKSFRKISEKFHFGVGNGSEAVIAQFYHSPADNKRVRKQLCHLGQLHRTVFWEDGGTWGLGGGGLCHLVAYLVASDCFSVNLGARDRAQFSG